MILGSVLGWLMDGPIRAMNGGYEGGGSGGRIWRRGGWGILKIWGIPGAIERGMINDRLKAIGGASCELRVGSKRA